MKKLFWTLVVVSLLGSGVLLYLIKNMPSSGAEDHVPAHGEVSEGHGDSEATPSDAHAESSHSEAAHDAHGEDTKQDIHHESGHQEESKPSSAEHGEVGAADRVLLKLSTEPVGVDIYVDDQYFGKSPADVPLKPEAQKMRLELEGFAKLEEMIPSEGQANAHDLHWSLKLSPAPEGQSSIPVIHGKHGPAFLQLKSVPWVQFDSGRYDLEASLLEGVVACKVEIKNKGTWARLLKGPFPRDYAVDLAKELKASVADVFVTGEQKCLD